MALHERECFHENPVTRPASVTCTRCRHRDDSEVRWMRRTKKDRIPPGADERDRAVYGTLGNHPIRVDDVLAGTRCPRTFEIPSQQSLVFV